MSFDVTASQEVNAPPERIAAVEFDPARDPEWIGGVDTVEALSPPPVTVGSRVRPLGGCCHGGGPR